MRGWVARKIALASFCTIRCGTVSQRGVAQAGHVGEGEQTLSLMRGWVARKIALASFRTFWFATVLQRVGVLTNSSRG